ncbi:hypothetical protein [Kitasatospora kifunensis]|uniref:Uncharacterized protein n=1 Tax=Kitasatospora kifunensis TaxID=58351 RepID=A0A7W7W0U5_KITKI|nr:hypothetical protein [Kitasatospora kifunensis]MBB4929069.1 hypothetical protein [Kitasatospora kifunensis]
MLIGRKKTNSDTEVLAELRECALRAIWRLTQENGPSDINPHTVRLTPHTLASMLTFTRDGSKYDGADPFFHFAHMIFAGKEENREARHDWAVWELERLDRPEAARRLDELVATEGGARAR